jgi:hypothetical protein
MVMVRDNAGIAQLVEQLICNHQVPSSILGAGTSLCRGGAVVARLAHNQEVGGAIPSPATNSQGWDLATSPIMLRARCGHDWV